MIKIKEIEGMGRGVVSSETIQAGSEIAACELLVLSPNDTILVNLTALKYYTFSYTQDQDCLALGIGELFNHADGANVSYAIEMRDGRNVMVFRATETIVAGMQLFINYAADTFVRVSNYVAAESLVG